MNEVSFSEILGAAQLRRAALPGELAGYLALAVADHLMGQALELTLPQLQLVEDGRVQTSGGLPCSEERAEALLVSLLSRLLLVASSVTPGLLRASRPRLHRSLAELVRELETALIPVNRGAARRALARLCREVLRARGQAQVEIAPQLLAPEGGPVGVVAPLRSSRPTPAVQAVVAVAAMVEPTVVEAPAVAWLDHTVPLPAVTRAAQVPTFGSALPVVIPDLDVPAPNQPPERTPVVSQAFTMPLPAVEVRNFSAPISPKNTAAPASVLQASAAEPVVETVAADTAPMPASFDSVDEDDWIEVPMDDGEPSIALRLAGVAKAVAAHRQAHAPNSVDASSSVNAPTSAPDATAAPAAPSAMSSEEAAPLLLTRLVSDNLLHDTVLDAPVALYELEASSAPSAVEQILNQLAAPSAQASSCTSQSAPVLTGQPTTVLFDDDELCRGLRRIAELQLTPEPVAVFTETPPPAVVSAEPESPANRGLTRTLSGLGGALALALVVGGLGLRLATPSAASASQVPEVAAPVAMVMPPQGGVDPLQALVPSCQASLEVRHLAGSSRARLTQSAPSPYAKGEERPGPLARFEGLRCGAPAELLVGSREQGWRRLPIERLALEQGPQNAAPQVVVDLAAQ